MTNEASQKSCSSFLASGYFWVLAIVICIEVVFGLVSVSIIYYRDSGLHRSEYVSLVVLFLSGLQLLFTVTAQRDEGKEGMSVLKKNFWPLMLFLGSVVAVLLAYPLREILNYLISF